MYLGALTAEQQAELIRMESDTKILCGKAEGHFPVMPILLGGAIGALLQKSNRSDGAVTGALYGLLASIALKSSAGYACGYLPRQFAELRRRGGA